MIAMMELRMAVQEAQGRWCVAVTLDIKNGFNMAGWKQIVEDLEASQVSGYLVRVFRDYSWSLFADHYHSRAKSSKLFNLIPEVIENTQ